METKAAILEAKELSETERWWFRSPPEEGYSVEFRLVYRGPLPSEPSPIDKHRIRQVLHPQLAILWEQNIQLKQQGYGIDPVTNVRSRLWEGLTFNVATQSGSHIYRFLPLITYDSGVTCAIDVLFMRRDAAGGLFRHGGGGDLDNRMKVLFDALRMPENDKEIQNIPPQPGEDPFFCLLQNDKFIDHLSITTDRLLLPQETVTPCVKCGHSRTEHIHDVLLIIGIKAQT
jgi:hypothetical protein